MWYLNVKNFLNKVTKTRVSEQLPCSGKAFSSGQMTNSNKHAVILEDIPFKLLGLPAMPKILRGNAERIGLHTSNGVGIMV